MGKKMAEQPTEKKSFLHSPNNAAISSHGSSCCHSNQTSAESSGNIGKSSQDESVVNEEAVAAGEVSIA